MKSIESIVLLLSMLCLLTQIKAEDHVCVDDFSGRRFQRGSETIDIIEILDDDIEILKDISNAMKKLRGKGHGNHKGRGETS